MPLDGLTLKVLVSELNGRLKNARILKIYQPAAHTITLHLRMPGETQILLISADGESARLHTVAKQPVNPPAPPPFCMLLRKYLESSRLLSLQQQGSDRIVHLRWESVDLAGELVEYTLIFELLGRHSNLLLVNKEGTILDALKRFPEAGIMPGEVYRTPPDQGKLDPETAEGENFITGIRLLPPGEKIWRWLQNTFQGFSKRAALEVVRRAGFSEDTKREHLEQADWEALYASFSGLMAELAAGGLPAYYEEVDDFAAYSLVGLKGENYPDADGLIAAVLGGRSERRRLQQLANSLQRQVNTHYRRVLKKEEIQKAALLQAKQADHWRHTGELLTANFHLLKGGLAAIELVDYTKEGQPLVSIELDPLLPPAANVQRVFKRYQKAKASQKHTARQLRKTRLERNYLEGISAQIEMADGEGILAEIEAELAAEGYLRRPPHRKSKMEDKGAEPARYLSPDGLPILVGRNNRQNDLLTFKLSSPRHLWLHARNQPGSHVIVLVEGKIPPRTLKQAALLAAYFSRARNSQSVPVDYTERRHVRKPKGAKPGFVRYEHAETIFVNPAEFEPPKEG